MIEALYNRSVYGPELAGRIEESGSYTISVANRWLLSWPDRVQTLLDSGEYLDCLRSQAEHEKGVLVSEPNMPHLARHDILQMHGVNPAPPAME